MNTLSQSSIDAFIDALWLEDGLSKNTLAAYRRDLSLYAEWLGAEAQRRRMLDETVEADLHGYFSSRHNSTRATSANRRLTVLKRYFRWALRERFITVDPTLKLQSAKQALRVPKTMSEAQVEALLAAPDETTPLGLRDHAMLELIYASGLRVSELVGLKTFHVGLNEGVLRVMGKGSKERLVPFGQIARDALAKYMAEARPAILNGQQTEDLFVTSHGKGMSRVMFWMLVKKPTARFDRVKTIASTRIALDPRADDNHPCGLSDIIRNVGGPGSMSFECPHQGGPARLRARTVRACSGVLCTISASKSLKDLFSPNFRPS